MWRQGARSRLYETDDADPAAALGSSASRATPTASPCRATPPTAAARRDCGARSTSTRPLPRPPIAAASQTPRALAPAFAAAHLGRVLFLLLVLLEQPER